jgi:diguanylate cyclase (GGDEF)-like protein
MTKTEDIISHFLDIVILKIDMDGEILEEIVNTRKAFKVHKVDNIYDLFAKEEIFRVKRILNSTFHGRKKYMELNKKTGVKEFVDVKVQDTPTGRYFYIQLFESNRDREVAYDRYIERLSTLSETDPLTKVLNRKGFEESIRRMVKLSDPSKRLGIVYFDMDSLKQVNDGYGHKIGDKAIVRIIDTLLSTVRERDIIARLGGDEFAIVVEEMTGSVSTTYGLAQRLKKRINRGKKDKSYSTISMGVHIFEVGKLQDHLDDFEKFSEEWTKELSKADKAVYESKHTGKNKISVSKEFRKYYKLKD